MLDLKSGLGITISIVTQTGKKINCEKGVYYGKESIDYFKQYP